MFGKDTQQNDQGAQFQAPEPVTPAAAPEPTPNATLEGDSSSTAQATPPAAPPELPDKAPAQPASSAPSMPSGKKSNTLTPPTLSTPASAPTTAPVASDDLMNLKQEALQQLSPLISHLDQTPEERFRTTMMMIQATDDSSKIKEAYEAAKQITDDKARAQALLDIVNEINYFTQQNQQENSK